MESELGSEVASALSVDASEFRARVDEEAQELKREIHEGAFDNPQAIVGFEYEFYAVNEETAALMRVPRRLLELIGFEKELGLHNAEMSTAPQPLNEHGLTAQEAAVSAKLSAALDRTRAEGMRLVSDAMWTIPPQGETAQGYLTDSIEDDGVRIATNMSSASRYHAMANTDPPAGMRLDAPNVTLQADTVMPESLITSIQPHYQVPHASDLPDYFRYALRVAGPLLALGVNSPFFPPDLYDDVSPRTVLDDAWMEHRISVFETAMNTEDVVKVRFPEDVDTVEEAVDDIVRDTTFVPLEPEEKGRFDDRFKHFRLKRGSYWRWVRPVFEGADRSAANARIEFRPIPSQPTVRDSVAFQAAYAGLLESTFRRDHPVRDLDWDDARHNFYEAMRDGIDADLRWITAEGDPTRDPTVLYADLLDTAAHGLRSRGVSDETVAYFIEPLRERVRRGVTPARWKHRAVARRIDDGLESAIYGMQREYLDRQRSTLIGGCFTDWLTE